MLWAQSSPCHLHCGYIRRLQNISAQIGVLIYGLSLVGLLSVSAIYHTFRWSEVMRLHMRRLDRSMIFVLTAGTQTPFLLVLEEQLPV